MEFTKIYVIKTTFNSIIYHEILFVQKKVGLKYFAKNTPNIIYSAKLTTFRFTSCMLSLSENLI